MSYFGLNIHLIQYRKNIINLLNEMGAQWEQIQDFKDNGIETGCEMILTFLSPFDILCVLEVRRSLVGLLDFKSSVGG